MTLYTAQSIISAAKKQIQDELERFEYMSDSLTSDLDEDNENEVHLGVVIDTLESAIQLLKMVKPYLLNQKKLEEGLSYKEGLK